MTIAVFSTLALTATAKGFSPRACDNNGPHGGVMLDSRYSFVEGAHGRQIKRIAGCWAVNSEDDDAVAQVLNYQCVGHEV